MDQFVPKYLLKTKNLQRINYIQLTMNREFWLIELFILALKDRPSPLQMHSSVIFLNASVRWLNYLVLSYSPYYPRSTSTDKTR